MIWPSKQWLKVPEPMPHTFQTHHWAEFKGSGARSWHRARDMLSSAIHYTRVYWFWSFHIFNVILIWRHGPWRVGIYQDWWEANLLRKENLFPLPPLALPHQNASHKALQCCRDSQASGNTASSLPFSDRWSSPVKCGQPLLIDNLLL